MIIVEIEVPIMGKKYDFQIDEDAPLYEVKEEAAEMICRREQCCLKGDVKGLLLWKQGGQKLKQEHSARENGLRTGSRIIMV